MRHEPIYRRRRAIAVAGLAITGWLAWQWLDDPAPATATPITTDAPVGIGNLSITIEAPTISEADATYAPTGADTPPPVSLERSLALLEDGDR